MRLLTLVSLIIGVVLSTPTHSESLGQINTDTLKREHEISLERKAGKISRDQEIKELKSARDKDVAAHAEASRQQRNKAGRSNQDTLIREHQIAVERKEGKISRNEAINEAKAAREKNAIAHARH